MGDWIDALGDDEEQRRKSARVHEQVQFRRAEVIRLKKQALWASLMNVISRDVEKFQTKFKGRRSVEMTTDQDFAFRLYKTPFPTVLMDAELPFNGTSILVSYTKTFNLDSPMERADEAFELTVDPSENLRVAHNGRIFRNLDEVSRFMLEPVFALE